MTLLMRRDSAPTRRSRRPKLPRPRRRQSARHATEDEFESPVGQWTNGSNLKTKAASAGLILALVLSPAGVVVGLAAASSGSAPTSETTVADTRGEQAAAQEFAARFVTTWLTSNADNADQRLSGMVEIPDGAEFPTVAPRATDATVADIEQLSGGVWSVTVAATVTPVGSDQGVLRFFAVPVVDHAGQLAAIALPAPIAAPTMAQTPSLNYPSDLSSTHPAWRTVAGFMGALLAGGDDITRYLTPGTHVASVVPVPFAQVRINQIATQAEAGAEPARTPADGQQLAVLVTAVGLSTTTDASGITVQYALVLTGRDGRWEVTEVEASPHLEDGSGDVTGGSSSDGSPVEEEQ
ncbi:MAG TPA: conjugal transfer protein [Nocardioidaceae bacterium]|nr:conjugal transfer protein [Nocardioidaceae bacterium]